MNCRRNLLASCVAICLAVTGGLNPALAGGLISTERVVEQRSQVGATAAASDRATLMAALLAAGVEREQAQTRLAALTDAEIVELRQTIDSAPAGGLWFVPFLLVAAVIGALIGTRDQAGGKPTTNLFGYPRVATSP